MKPKTLNIFYEIMLQSQNDKKKKFLRMSERLKTLPAEKLYFFRRFSVNNNITQESKQRSNKLNR